MYVEIDPTQLKRLASEGKMARKSQRIESTGENAWLQALLVGKLGIYVVDLLKQRLNQWIVFVCFFWCIWYDDSPLAPLCGITEDVVRLASMTRFLILHFYVIMSMSFCWDQYQLSTNIDHCQPTSANMFLGFFGCLLTYCQCMSHVVARLYVEDLHDAPAWRTAVAKGRKHVEDHSIRLGSSILMA